MTATVPAPTRVHTAAHPRASTGINTTIYRSAGDQPPCHSARGTRYSRYSAEELMPRRKAGGVVGQRDRAGEIVEVHGGAGEPPYLVRFDDGHTSLVFPGPDAVVEHPTGQAPRTKAAKS